MTKQNQSSDSTEFTVSTKAPFWVQDNAGILRILHRFVDQLDGKRQTKLFISSRTTPELFDFDQQPEDRLWPLIADKLSAELGFINIKLKRKLAWDAPQYEGARVSLATDEARVEQTLRTWLERPSELNYAERWRQAVDQARDALPLPDAFYNPIKSDDLTATQIVEGFVRLSQQLTAADADQTTLSLRTLSARCFAGDSKFLDQRRKFVEHAFPLARAMIAPRAIMLSVYIPSELKAAIFVENFDSFRSTVRAVTRSPMGSRLAVVYSAGYRSSANLIRERGHSQFVTINQVQPNQYHQFCDWWFSEQQDIDVLFWGDLDYEGMSILKTLRFKFFNARSFKAAYQGVLDYHSRGVSHPFHHGNKGRQTDPMNTGCDFADRALLPAIRHRQSFTDQEVLSESEILSAIVCEFEHEL